MHALLAVARWAHRYWVTIHMLCACDVISCDALLDLENRVSYAVGDYHNKLKANAKKAAVLLGIRKNDRKNMIAHLKTFNVFLKSVIFVHGYDVLKS